MQEKSLGRYRLEALRDPEYLLVKRLKVDGITFRCMAARRREQELEDQLQAFADYRRLQDLYLEGSSATEINKALGTAYHPDTINRYGTGKTRPSKINPLRFRKRVKLRRISKRLDLPLTELVGHYLWGMTTNLAGMPTFASKDNALVELVAGLASRKSGKNVKARPYGKGRPQVVISDPALVQLLNKVTSNRRRIPLADLAEPEKRRVMLKTAFTHHGWVMCVPARKSKTIDLAIDLKSRKHLVPQLLPLLADYDVFPNVTLGRGSARLFIGDRNDLLRLIKLGVLGEQHSERLSRLFKQHSETSRRNTPVSAYEAWLKNPASLKLTCLSR